MTGPSGSDGMTEELVLFAALALSAGLLWMLAGEELIWAAAAASAGISLPAAFAADLLGQREIPLLSPLLLDPARLARDLFFSAADRGEVIGSAADICRLGGRSAALAAAPLCLTAAASAAGGRPDRAFRRRHDLDSMIAEQARVWPAAARPAALDPSLDSEPETGVCPEETRLRIKAIHAREERRSLPETGSHLYPEQLPVYSPPPLGRAMRPEEWLDAAGLRGADGHVSRESAEAVLSRQLTRPWRGPGELRPHERAFCACLGLFAAGGPELADPLIDSLSRAFAAVKAPGGCAAVLDADPALAGRVAAALDEHDGLLRGLADGGFWVETALSSIWERGREGGGVLAPARFLWLKAEDRAVWYAVNGVGANPVVEAAGIRAQHLAERQYGFACPAPHMLHAARALTEIYMDREQSRLEAREKRASLRRAGRSVAEKMDEEAAA